MITPFAIMSKKIPRYEKLEMTEEISVGMMVVYRLHYTEYRPQYRLPQDYFVEPGV